MNEMMGLDDLIDTVIDKDELAKGIAQFAVKSADELKKEFKVIDDKYDAEYSKLEEERRYIYKDELESLNRESALYEKLVLESKSDEEKEKYLELYVKTSLKKSAFFEMANKKVDKKDVETKEEQKKGKMQKIALAAIPFASIAIYEGGKWFFKNFVSKHY